MKEQDIKAWLYAYGYYMENYSIVDALRTFADEYDD